MGWKSNLFDLNHEFFQRTNLHLETFQPIPYWLYKLHGLNLYYDCEICGNHKYRGPKAFQRHFAEWRHAHGMRCLGIPNTAHFANITSIEDASQLWEKLRVTREMERFRPENQVNNVIL